MFQNLHYITAISTEADSFVIALQLPAIHDSQKLKKRITVLSECRLSSVYCCSRAPAQGTLINDLHFQ